MPSFLLFLTCVIFFIQTTVSQPTPPPAPKPEPTPAPEPKPEPVPVPHPTPEPVPVPEPKPEPVPVPHPTPEPTPGSEPHPEPGPHPETPNPGMPPEPTPNPGMPPEPMPVPTPEPAPMPTPTVDDFYFSVVIKSTFGGSYSGAISMSGNNDTITVFGNKGTMGNFDFVQQFSLTSYQWSNLTTWNTSRSIISFSQPPPDGNVYPTYFLWTAGTPPEYWVSTFSNPTFTDLFNISFPPGEIGQRIVALTNGNVYIYGSLSGLRVYDPATNMVKSINTTQPGGWRDFPALVGYMTGFFVHGGLNNGTATNDFYYYDPVGNEWTPRNSTHIPVSFNHIATLSSYPLYSGNMETFIYFTGITDYSIILYDVNANTTSVPTTKMSLDPLDMPLSTIAGSRLFIFGGMDRNTSMVMSELWQFVNERYCTSVSNCDDCVSYSGCIFCASAVASGAPSCVSGNTTHPYITQTCAPASGVISTVETCPEAFPSWAIALIVIGGVILVGGIVFGIMKLRAVKPGYDPV